MNSDSQQSKIVQAYLDLNLCLPGQKPNPHYKIIEASATPFSRISEAQTFAVATRKPYKFGHFTEPMTNKHWPSYAKDIAWGDPREHNKAAIKRLMDDLDPWVVKVSHVRPKFRPHNSIKLIPFATREDALEYQATWDEYVAKLADIGRDEPEGLFKVFAIILQHRKKCERIRAPYLARHAKEAVDRGRSVGIAVNFKDTLVICKDTLVNDLGVPLEQISMIWGGVDKSTWDEKIIKDLELKVQNHEQRQKEIDKFQEGKAYYCLFTFKAGGAGLSLHHDRANGRPRTGIIAPTYSDKEMVQAMGRLPRFTSLSDTEQVILLFSGTIEVEVAAKLKTKLECLREVVGSRETWVDILAPKQLTNLTAYTNEYKKQESIADDNDIEREDIITGQDEELDNGRVIDVEVITPLQDTVPKLELTCPDPAIEPNKETIPTSQETPSPSATTDTSINGHKQEQLNLPELQHTTVDEKESLPLHDGRASDGTLLPVSTIPETLSPECKTLSAGDEILEQPLAPPKQKEPTVTVDDGWASFYA